MTKPRVTVLIPTYNRAHFLAECLDSVLGQTIPPAQVLVINDGSTDNTREALAPYMDRIEYIEKENGGKSTALNLALLRVRGDYVWIMDDDDVALPDALETHLAVLENEPSIGFTWTARFDARTRPEGNGMEIVGRRHILPSEEGDLFLELLEGNVIGSESLVVRRRSCYARVGLFSPELIRSQDYDMALRVARHFKGKSIDKPSVLYRLHSGDRGSAAVRFAQVGNNLKWREYDQQIFRRLREELELSEYLPEKLRSHPLGPLEKRRAYLKRMAAMAAHGMIGEMVEDLQQALSCPTADAPLSPTERAIVLRSADYLWPEDLSPLRRELAARRFPTSRAGTEIKIEMARVLYWRLLWAVRDRRLSGLLDIVRTSGRVVGLRGIPPLLRARFSKSRRSSPESSPCLTERQETSAGNVVPY